LAVNGAAHDPFDFRPMDFEAERSCDQAEFACYLLGLSHGTEGTDRMAIRASQREFDSTVRLYFGDDFFDHLSVFPSPATGSRASSKSSVAGRRRSCRGSPRASRSAAAYSRPTNRHQNDVRLRHGSTQFSARRPGSTSPSIGSSRISSR
jgi:hypothetical protein